MSDEGMLTLHAKFAGNSVRVTSPRSRPLKESIVTIGGVDTREINPRTMESKLLRGLFFAGEVMDIDGPTGGYNLTLAFATAGLAVSHIAGGDRPQIRYRK
jgi:predicted flavoprotein YhiN